MIHTSNVKYIEILKCLLVDGSKQLPTYTSSVPRTHVVGWEARYFTSFVSCIDYRHVLTILDILREPRSSNMLGTDCP